MKRIVFFSFVFLLISLRGSPAEKKKILVVGSACVCGTSCFGSGGKITVLRDVPFMDTLLTISLRWNGQFRFQLPDPVAAYHLFFSKPGYWYTAGLRS